ncbi:MAG TPA: TonB-dependent receptor, partial [Cryomorphaceae bacterium]|nr:TonB-dependent receptor [Cryomorphaceae bacterium]
MTSTTLKVTHVNERSIHGSMLSNMNTGQDIPYVLQWTPSMTQASDAGTGMGYTYLRMRGMDQTRINVTLNGAPLNDPESHGVFWVNTPDLTSSLN